MVTTSFTDRADSIGLGAYTVDIPGPAQRIVVDGAVANEGSIKVPFFCDPTLAPYPLPFGVMLPKRAERPNLLVPVAISASHVAFNSVRTPTQWMILGQVRGWALPASAALLLQCGVCCG